MQPSWETRYSGETSWCELCRRLERYCVGELSDTLMSMRMRNEKLIMGCYEEEGAGKSSAELRPRYLRSARVLADVLGSLSFGFSCSRKKCLWRGGTLCPCQVCSAFCSVCGVKCRQPVHSPQRSGCHGAEVCVALQSCEVSPPAARHAAAVTRRAATMLSAVRHGNETRMNSN
jgi:hypothetical protein